MFAPARRSSLILGGICLLLFSATLTLAEEPKAGVLVGLNLNAPTLGGVDAIDDVSDLRLTRLIVGGYLSLPIKGRVVIQPELTYTQKHFDLADKGDFT